MNWAIWLGLTLLWALILAWRARVERHNPDARRLAGDILAGGILFSLTVAFFWRTISGDVFQPADGGDLVSFLYPTYRFAASQISQWVLPLWNPHLYGGAPFISDIQAGFFYPPNFLLFLIEPEFSYPTMQWLAVGHLYWAGLGMYILLRTMRFDGQPVGQPAALLGALAFQFSDAFFIHLGNLNLIAVLSWLPWVFAAYLIALDRRSMRWTVVAALLFTVANYAGHAQSSYYIGLALAAYTAVWFGLEMADLWGEQGNDGGTRWLRAIWAWLQYLFVVALLTGLLTAPILLPSLELTQYTARQDFTYQESIAFSLAPTQAAVGLFTPGFFGRGPALFWGLWDRVETPYVGVVTLMLAVIGYALASKGTRRKLWPWLGVAVFGMLIALGVYGIVHGLLTVVLPGFDQFRAPARAIVLWALGISVMGGVGADVVVRRYHRPANTGEQALPRGARDRRVNTLLFAGSVIFVGLVVPLLFFALLATQDDPNAFLHASLAALAVVLAAAFWLATWAVVAGYRAGWIGAGVFGVSLIALLFIELTATGAYTDISSTDPARGFDHPEIVEFLQADGELFRIDTRTDIADLWQPDTAELHGLQDVWGVANPLLLRHWSDLWEATGGRQTERYDMLNVKYVLVRDGTPLPEGKFELALDAPGDLSLYRNSEVMPRAWLVHEVVTLPLGSFDEGDLGALFAEYELNPQITALVESANAEDLTVTPALSAADESTDVTHFGASSMTLDVSASAPALLVLSEVWYPGWRATVNGQATDILRANGALRALSVPAGDSTVLLDFMPSSWIYGLVASMIGALLAIILFVGGSGRKERDTISVDGVSE